jgi:hypothetical protein
MEDRIKQRIVELRQFKINLERELRATEAAIGELHALLAPEQPHDTGTEAPSTDARSQAE